MIERPIVAGLAPASGPYVHVIRVENLLFVSGQGPFDPVSNQFVLGSVQDQTRLVIKNIRAILASCGATLKDVVKCSVYLESPGDFAAMNEVYADYFAVERPTRTTIAAMLVVPGMKVEIDCIAYSPRTILDFNKTECGPVT